MTVSREVKVLFVLLIFIPLTIISTRLGWPGWLQFFLSVAAVVPLAGLIGAATDELAHRLGARGGGLLNATFGNAPDLLIGVIGVQRGLIPLVKATLIGALISNSALIIGICFLGAGLNHGKARFHRVEAGHHSVLMLLTVAAILFPSAGAFALCGGLNCSTPASQHGITTVSLGISGALLVGYLGYVAFSIFKRETLTRKHRVRIDRTIPPGTWPTWIAVGVLAGSTALLIPVIDTLTSSVSAVTTFLGWTEVFVGIIIVANAGNVAEAYAAIRAAIQRPGLPATEGEETGLDLAMGIASASSIQIATLILPVVVIVSLFYHPMNLVFGPVEIAILGLMVIVFSEIAHDGETNWLEGLLLLVLYVMAAVVFYALPASAF